VPAALTGDWVPFVSNRENPDFDIFLYNPDTDQVLSPPGANTPGNEDFPLLSTNGRWLVFLTDWPRGDTDVRLYDLVTRRLDLLPALNTRQDELTPAIDNAPTLIAFTRREGQAERLHLYDLATHQETEVVAASRLARVVRDPYLALDKTMIAFTAAIDGGDSDIYCYDLAQQTVFTPPHVNSSANEFDPSLSDDNRRVTYLSDRGSPSAAPDLDVYVTDWRTGYTDNLPLGNAVVDELAPYFYKDGVVFISDRGDGSRYFYYDMKRQLLDTWPIAHEPGADDL
jgi:Tol biopolymer transport system component